MSRTLLLIIALLLIQPAIVPNALAQDAGSSSADRHSRSESTRESARQKTKGAKGADASAKKFFPDATRQEPKLRLSSRGQRNIQKLLELSQGEPEDQDKARKMAEEMLADERVKGYQRAFAERVMADLALEQDDTETAIRHFQAAIDENALPNEAHYSTMLGLAQTLMNDGQTEKGLQVLERLIAETRTTNPDYLILRANALYQLERYPEGIAAAKAVIEATPEPKDSWIRLLVGLYAANDQPLLAAEQLKVLIAKNPNDKSARLNLAGMYQEANDYASAVAILEEMQAQGMLTEERDYRALYALYANMEGHEADVIRVIRTGLDKGILRKDAKTYIALAQSYYFSEHIPEAIEAYKQAAELAADGQPALNLARIYANEGMYKEAKASAQDALSKGLDKPGYVWIVLAQAERGLNNRPAMIAAMKKAAQYPETRDSAQQWLRTNKIK